MEKIEKIADDLYVKKSLGEWIIVRPIKKDLEKPFGKGNINWKNLLIGGSWFRFIKIMAIFAILIFLILAYKQDMKNCSTALNSPCMIQCRALDPSINNFSFDVSNFSNFSNLEVINNERQNVKGNYFGQDNQSVVSKT